MQTEARDTPIYAVIAAVQLPNVPDFEFDASLTELRFINERTRQTLAAKRQDKAA